MNTDDAGLALLSGIPGREHLSDEEALIDALTNLTHHFGPHAMLRALGTAFMHYEAEAGVDVDWSIVPLPERTP